MTAEPVLLGVIALATTVMAVVQVTAAVYAARAAREATRAAQYLQREIGPILANARQASDDAARVTALALTQVERVSRLVETTTARIDETLGTVQDVILGPVRQGSAIWAGVRAALAFFSQRQSRARYSRDEDENLFIG